MYLPADAAIASRPTTLPSYDNGVRGVPAHWIKLYGTAHGMFYDPLTKLFFGDGLPRATLVRGADGGMPAKADATAIFQDVDQDPADAIHVTSRNLMHQFANIAPDAERMMWCRCTGQWVEDLHECLPAIAQRHPGQLILPGGTLFLPEWFTHSNFATDTSYIERVGPCVQLGQPHLADVATTSQANGDRQFQQPTIPNIDRRQRDSVRSPNVRSPVLGRPLPSSTRRNTMSSSYSPRQHQERVAGLSRYSGLRDKKPWYPGTF